MKDSRACRAQGLVKKSNWSDYLRTCKELNQTIREKMKICREGFVANASSNYRKNIKAFWKLVNGSIKSNAKNRIEALTDGSVNSFSTCAGKVKILKST